MQIPAVRFIKAGWDAVLEMSQVQRDDELRELSAGPGDFEFAVGAETANSSLGARLGLFTGYLLGLETARAVLASSDLLRSKGIDARELL